MPGLPYFPCMISLLLLIGNFLFRNYFLASLLQQYCWSTNYFDYCIKAMHPVHQCERFVPNLEVTMFSHVMSIIIRTLKKMLYNISKSLRLRKSSPLCWNVMCLKSIYIQRSNRPSFPLILTDVDGMSSLGHNL